MDAMWLRSRRHCLPHGRRLCWRPGARQFSPRSGPRISPPLRSGRGPERSTKRRRGRAPPLVVRRLPGAVAARHAPGAEGPLFVPQARSVFVTAVELRRHGRSHYQMRPVKTAWNAGWQEFSPWPTADVLAPLQISPENLGVVARLDQEQDGSGSIAPVIVYAGRYPADAARSRSAPPAAQHPLRSRLHARQHRRRHARGQRTAVQAGAEAARPCVAGNVPFEIVLDLARQPAGNYRLVLDTKEYGRTKGPSHQYFFRHEAQ